MFSHIDPRRFLVPLTVVLAMVLVVLPTVQMVGCDMNMGAMPFMPNGGAYSDCPGQWVVKSAATSGIVPSGAGSLNLGLLIAVLVVGLSLFSPRRATRRVLAYVGDPPPPPLSDSFGARFRV